MTDGLPQFPRPVPPIRTPVEHALACAITRVLNTQAALFWGFDPPADPVLEHLRAVDEAWRRYWLNDPARTPPEDT